MKITLDKSGSFDTFSSLLKDANADNEIQSILLLSGNNPEYKAKCIDPILKNLSKPIIGGIFTSVFFEEEIFEKGVLVIGLPYNIQTHVISNLSEPNTDFEKQFIAIDEAGSEEYSSMFVFVDGYAGQIAGFIESLFNVFGVNLNYIGGGAGTINTVAIEMQSNPCLFTNKGLINESAVIGLTKIKSGIGIKHGWTKIKGAHKITESSGNVIKTIDRKPALEVYKKIVEEHSQKNLTTDNFFDVAKCYPFGLNKIGSEIVVRDPFTADGEALILATPIPNESFINILTGNIDSLIKAAEEAKEQAQTNLGQKGTFMFVVDCISRYLFYGDRFIEEIDAIKIEGIPLFGALSMGEIANMGKNYMELYNKTCVVGLMSE